jgi:hypothetical protein
LGNAQDASYGNFDGLSPVLVGICSFHYFIGNSSAKGYLGESYVD